MDGCRAETDGLPAALLARADLPTAYKRDERSRTCGNVDRPTAGHAHVILVLRALGLGDLLTAVPALRALRAARPRDRLVLAAPGWLRPVVDLADCVDELHATPMAGALRWNAAPPSIAVNLHGAGPASIADLLATGPQQLITYRHADFPLVPGPPWPTDVHETSRWCMLLESAGIPADPTRLDLDPPPGTSSTRAHIVVHPGGSSPARQWPATRFATVIANLREWGYPIMVTGSANDAALAQFVAERAGLPRHAAVAGELTLGQLATTIASAALVVSGDTGVGHLATAFGTPSVLVFGPNPPEWWGPPSHRQRHTALWAGHASDPHAAEPDRGLLMINAAEVAAAADRQLAAWNCEARV
ncbi:glycosyltransferase family 9 protein [Nocardia sp. NPDC049220]|uniref:glycosyltransferase family 9 protein n=1 Tax=Nocardia sp. NPDC049220 TaxID=3155273 RepID=UPI0033E43FF7